jgi:hypothetical protein
VVVLGLGKGFGAVKGNSGHFGKILKSGFKIDVVKLLNEGKNVPGLAATETFEDLELGGNDKRRGFFTMKRAVGQVMTTAFFER